MGCPAGSNVLLLMVVGGSLALAVTAVLHMTGCYVKSVRKQYAAYRKQKEQKTTPVQS